ncbi:MAG TPA: hypothetical protein VG759_13375 [Candidatus Angelobacter sp.]|jgi:hypothetical protein|nr:hypothetical protein [Candidatus Angelobacter sp.]
MAFVKHAETSGSCTTLQPKPTNRVVIPLVNTAGYCAGLSAINWQVPANAELKTQAQPRTLGQGAFLLLLEILLKGRKQVLPDHHLQANDINKNFAGQSWPEK